MATISGTAQKTSQSAIQQISDQEWQAEITKSSENFHRIGAWIAVFFNPIFAVVDYLNIPDAWLEILYLRLIVSVITFGGIYAYRQKKISVALLVAIPFILISLQNAYTYNLIGQENLLGHNLNYLALFMGAGFFILWSIEYSLIALVASGIVSFIFISGNDAFTVQKFTLDGGVLLIAGAIFSVFLIQARYSLTRREIKARLALNKSLEVTERQKEEIRVAKESIEQMNHQLSDYNDELEDMVEQRTAKLKQSNDERDKLVYRLSHDFKTPMTNVRMMTNLAKKTEEREKIASFLTHIDNNLNQFDDLLQDMNNYSVYSRDDLNISTFDWTSLVQDIWNTQSKLRTDAEVELELIPAEAGAYALHLDQEKTHVLISSVLANAIRYRKPEGPAKIQVKITRENGNHVISIHDEGVGIKAEVLPKVCDMFFRADARSKGAGMGLYMAKGIAEQFGGTLEVASQEGVSTTVSITLPAD